MSDENRDAAPRPDDDGEDRGKEERHRRRDRAAGYTDATGGDRDVPDAEVLAHEHARPGRDRHDFEPDVERIHRPLFREPRAPLEGREPAPWWVWAAAAIALFWGGWYLGRYGGTLDTTPHIAIVDREGFVAEQAAEQQAESAADPVAAGAAIYESRCQQCHQQDGRGMAGAFPPLIGSEWVTGPEETVIRILLDGLQGPIEVAGTTYNGRMPAWRDALSNEEIAAVATYIRQWDENDAGPVEPERVGELRRATVDRTEPWTADALRAAAAGGGE